MAHILVIEDDPASRELIRYLLEAFGYTVLTADDGVAGIEVAHREVVDLILCDVRLPRIDGFEVARQLKSHPTLRTIPLVAITAYAMVGDRDRMLKAGFDDYLPKPIVPETFIKQIEDFLWSGQTVDDVEPHQEMADDDTPSPRPSAGRVTPFPLNGSSAKILYELVCEFLRARTVHPPINRSWRVQWQPS